jgi:transcription-repair coupling factor (superfamily II helicase)
MSDLSYIDFLKIQGYPELIGKLQGGIEQIPLSLPRSVRLPFLAALQRDTAKPVLFITSRPDRLLSMHEEYGFWSKTDDHLIFAEPTPLFYEKANWDVDTRRDRLQSLVTLARSFLPYEKSQALNPVIFTSAKSIMTRTAPRRDFLSACSVLRVQTSIPMNTLAQKWSVIGYSAVEIVVSEGQFSKRGGLMDIWPVNYANPIRVDFFGEEIETIRTFDPATQRTIDPVEEIFIPPANEAIKVFANEDQLDPLDRNPEFNIPRLYASNASLLDYLPRGTVILIDNSASVSVTAEEIEEQAVKMRAEAIETGIIEADFPVPYITWSEIMDTLSTFHVIDLGFPLGSEVHPVSAAFSPSQRFGAQMDRLTDYIHSKQEKNRKVFIVSKQTERLKEVFHESNIDFGDGNKVIISDGSLSGGWEVIYKNADEAVLLTDQEIFGWERERTRRRRTKSFDAPEFSYADLKDGDLVVHVDYGIGRFRGLVHRMLDGVERDYLTIGYADDDLLYVPVHQADRLGHYIGADEQTPRLTRLGSGEWAAAKQRAGTAVQEVAQELLELYAQRQDAKGYVFSRDTEWQKNLESSFPFTETPDQARAIEEVKSDMEKARPMDRLLCGDVGYGKTEVALRAAFKAVMDGKQVAMLVPTTVLAQQHFDTFQKRLTPFPVKVEMLSRFRSPSEQAEILLELEAGDVDIIIGTHRLLQPDVLFKDLGLLIIDEEQRFGVTHKEYFKKKRTELDVLTLTATPIPRTLYMAIAGIRDISVINSPPTDRLPIQTYVGGYDPEIVRRAITREVDRGGQVFFVHNRVQTIGAMASHLQNIVPEARVGIAHGQMQEKGLEEVMRRFTAGEVDVLLSTSIIESGLDIPNANTLIVDRGDAFGLSQLYQLRGRVGRGASRAYAYFFHHRKKLPTPEGLERLETIAENIQLGAGYSIAMRDLEMRGAGNLLGTMQHGHIAAVGFHLYTRLLSEAVNTIKKPEKPSPDEKTALPYKGLRPLVTVELPISVGISTTYIADEALRLQIYRRLADIINETDLETIRAEFTDRFGQPDEGLENLLWQLKIKLKAEHSGLASITVESNHLVLRYPQLPEGIKERDLPDIGINFRRGKNAYWIQITDRFDWKTSLENALLNLENQNLEKVETDGF